MGSLLLYPPTRLLGSGSRAPPGNRREGPPRAPGRYEPHRVLAHDAVTRPGMKTINQGIVGIAGPDELEVLAQIREGLPEAGRENRRKRRPRILAGHGIIALVGPAIEGLGICTGRHGRMGIAIH